MTPCLNNRNLSSRSPSRPRCSSPSLTRLEYFCSAPTVLRQSPIPLQIPHAQILCVPDLHFLIRYCTCVHEACSLHIFGLHEAQRGCCSASDPQFRTRTLSLPQRFPPILNEVSPIHLGGMQGTHTIDQVKICISQVMSFVLR
jgi:hypothetical protein